ncbi:MAG TPA: M20 aminoacylase family protein [Beijerinckiaceae bacterium]|nr:M20 aminoacylase family protein [Beijerinckiaceae bacterium]
MAIDSRVLDLAGTVRGWRQQLHQQPELGYEVHRTAAFVAEKLRAFGCDEVVEGIGRTGVVGIVHGRKGAGGRVVGLRADMDALPIEEETNLPYRSKVAGVMHACGHDGHTAMLLGAARHLTATREFDGTVALIFQPAEEGGAGGKAMVEDGMMDRWSIAEVYGMHNMPGQPVGSFGARSGPIMAAADEFVITVEGKGGHAAAPHLGVDPVIVGVHIISALQTIASRNADPLHSVVVSTTMFHAGTAFNVIPTRAELTGTVRTLNASIRSMAEARLKEIAIGTARVFGANATVSYRYGYPATVNHERETILATEIARGIAGPENVDGNIAPMMGGEDFSYMLEARPGAYLFIGNGDTAGLHNAAYDFNDEVLPYGMQFFINVARERTAR